jgi:hypothetical protein
VIELRIRSRIPESELQQKIGKLLTENDHNVRLAGPARVLKPDGSLLCVYLPGIVKIPMQTAYQTLTRIRGTTDNRGHASGAPTIRGGSAYGGSKGGNRTRAKKITSQIIGAIDGAGSGEENYCRLTAYTARQAEEWPRLFPLFQQISDRFADHVPGRYAVQVERALATPPEWVIPGTPFTTITVNSTYPTGVHTDKGDLEAGFSCLAVARRGAFTGGRLTFPAFRVAVDMQDGDLLLMDAHEYHGNTPITCDGCGASLDRPGHACEHSGVPVMDGWESPERISVVCYYRSEMVRCGTQEEEAAKRAAVAEKQSRRALRMEAG